MKIKALKRNAKESLKGNWGKAILAGIIYGISQGVMQGFFNGVANFLSLGQIFTDNADQLPVVPQIVVLLFTTFFSAVLSYGMIRYYLKLIRGEEKSYSDLFYYLRSGEQFIRAGITGILVFIFTLLWTLLLIVPGIIKGLSYMLVPFILNDFPELKPLEAITLSRRMMDGFKGKAFLLGLSFILWGLLIVFTFGLALFYVGPYYQATFAQFYEEVKSKYEERVL